MTGAKTMRIDPRDYERLDLRAHSLLADVAIHDVWAVDLPGGGPGRTVLDVLAVISAKSLRRVTPTALLGHLRPSGQPPDPVVFPPHRSLPAPRSLPRRLARSLSSLGARTGCVTLSKSLDSRKRLADIQMERRATHLAR